MDSAGEVSHWNNYTAMCATIFATTLFRYVDIGGQVSHMNGAGEWNSGRDAIIGWLTCVNAQLCLSVGQVRVRIAVLHIVYKPEAFVV